MIYQSGLLFNGRQIALGGKKLLMSLIVLK
jgi:hypothetical protein